MNKSKERCKNYRKKILDLSQKVPALHIGGAFSSVEIVDTIFNNLKKKKGQIYIIKRACGYSTICSFKWLRFNF